MRLAVKKENYIKLFLILSISNTKKKIKKDKKKELNNNDKRQVLQYMTMTMMISKYAY